MNKKIDPSKIKALAIDLDGTTLLPGAILGERTLICLKKLLSQGMQLIIATGRAIEASECYLDAIGSEGPMVFFNGASVVDIPSGKTLSLTLVDNDIMDFCIETARSMGIYFQIYLPAGISPETGKFDTENKWGWLAIEKPGEELELYQKHTGLIPVIKDLKSITAMPEIQGCVKGMYIVDPSLHEELRRRLDERFGSRISITRSFPTYLEVLNKGVSKGEGLKIAMQHRGLKPEEVIAFGDEENDLSMFTAAGFSGAPQSAREKIREAADFTFGSNAEEGLAVWLEETFQI
jgi:Cof subfamily protein (haloacid dehalogenase superfamily)